MLPLWQASAYVDEVNNKAYLTEGRLGVRLEGAMYVLVRGKAVSLSDAEPCP